MAGLRKESDIQKRRRIAKKDARIIQRLDDALALGNALASESARDLLKSFADMVVGGSIAELFALCEWRRHDEASTGQL